MNYFHTNNIGLSLGGSRVVPKKGPGETTRLPDLPDLAARVNWGRTRLGWNQTKLARAVGADQTTISSIETGETRQPRIIYRIGKALGLSPAWLMFGISELDRLDRADIVRALKIQQLSNKSRQAIDNLVDQLLK